MSVLQAICDDRRLAVERCRREVSVEALRESPLYDAPTHSLRAALSQPGLQVIAEHKRASPSQGSYGVQLSPVEVALAYQAAGAAALSVLTEPSRFGGSLDHLRAIRKAVPMPLLRKDFIVDAYQLHEAKAAGADAVLLIAAALTLEEAQELRTTAHHLDLEVLLEIHSDAELDYLSISPDVVGVNNRNLATLQIDLNTSASLVEHLPEGQIRISESGIQNGGDGQKMEALGYDGVLIGTQFMTTAKPGEALATFLNGVSHAMPLNSRQRS